MPLGTQAHLGDHGEPVVYAKEAKDPCPRCGYRFNIEEQRISARVTRYVCPQCSSTWEKIRVPKQKPPPPPKPPKPTGPTYDSPAARADLAAESSEPELAESKD